MKKTTRNAMAGIMAAAMAALTGVISMDDNPTTQVIKVVPEPQSQPK